MTDDLFLKYPYEDEEDYLTESDFCELQDNKESFEDNWFYTQDDFEDYSDESEYLIGLPSDHEGVIKSNNLFFTYDSPAAEQSPPTLSARLCALIPTATRRYMRHWSAFPKGMRHF